MPIIGWVVLDLFLFMITWFPAGAITEHIARNVFDPVWALFGERPSDQKILTPMGWFSVVMFVMACITLLCVKIAVLYIRAVKALRG